MKIDNENTISTTNIGDSGYLLYHLELREDGEFIPKMYYRSQEGQKSFNFPYQIGSRGDDPKTAGEDNTHTFDHGDILLVYSDGVSDNLYSQNFAKCLDGMISPQGLVTSYGAVADCIARQAYKLGKDPTYFSPFTKGAKEARKKH